MRSVTKTSKYVIHEESETSLIGSEMSLMSLEDAMDALGRGRGGERVCSPGAAGDAQRRDRGER